MAIRFLEDGFEYLDPMSGASTAGMGVVYDDGLRSAPWEDRPGYGVNDLVASEALRWMSIPAEQIRMTRPPVPQQLFPPRFGYSHDPVTIDDVFTDEMWRPQVRSWAWTPGAREVPLPSPRGWEEAMWSGSTRDSMAAGGVNPYG